MGLRENDSQNQKAANFGGKESASRSPRNENAPGLYSDPNQAQRFGSGNPAGSSSSIGTPRKSTVFNTPILSMPVNTTVQKICIGMGLAFIALGLIGFGIPTFFGAHLSAIHNWIHILSGVAALWVGLRKSAFVANRFATLFGTFYGLLGISGFIFGKPGISSMHLISETDRFLLPVISGKLEFGTNDHVLHVIIGAVFLIPAWVESQKTRKN